MNETERRREMAYHYAGAAVIGTWVGRKVARVTMGGARKNDGILEWDRSESAKILRAYGDCLDFFSEQALVSYGGDLAEEIDAGGAPDLSSFPDEEAARRVGELLDEWRGAYPDAVAYVEEFLDYPALRRTARQAVHARWTAVEALAGRLLEKESGGLLSGPEVETLLASALPEDGSGASWERKS